MPATLVADDLVVSEGVFQGDNGTVNWHVESRMDDGISVVYNTITLTSDEPLGDCNISTTWTRTFEESATTCSI